MSSSSSISDDDAIAFVAGMLAAFCTVMAVRAFARKRIGISVAWGAGGALFAFVAYFFVAFRIRLF